MPLPALPPSRKLLASVAAALTFPAVVVTASVSQQSQPLAETMVERVALNAEVLGVVDPDAIVVVPEFLSRGDTLLGALGRMGVFDPAAERFVTRERAAKPLLAAAPGGFLRVARTGAGELVSLEYSPPSGGGFRLDRVGEGFRVTREFAAGETQLRYRAGVGGPSLFRAFADAGFPKSIGEQVVRIFSKQFDLHAAARGIERFAVVYEEHAAGSAGLRAGRVLGAEVVRSGKSHRAFWFSADRGRTGAYYGPEGFSLDREFLPAPLEYTEVTSWFGVSRQIGKRYQESHPGIDYAAPVGTPVHATADGEVEFAGVQRGYGNVVIVKHREPLATVYAHLNGFAEGVANGFRVRQGEVIGYVGTTGWSTGPHLHYEVRVSDQPVNPENVAVVAAELAKPQRVAEFRERIAPLASNLDLLASAAPARFE